MLQSFPTSYLQSIMEDIHFAFSSLLTRLRHSSSSSSPFLNTKKPLQTCYDGVRTLYVLYHKSQHKVTFNDATRVCCYSSVFHMLSCYPASAGDICKSLKTQNESFKRMKKILSKMDKQSVVWKDKELLVMPNTKRQ